MRKTIKNAVSETVQDMLDAGLGTSFTEKELKELGVTIPEISIKPKKVKLIRKKTRLSQSVFARVLNVSPSSIRQWEQGTRTPTGSTKVLLDVLDREPHILNYRIKSSYQKRKNIA